MTQKDRGFILLKIRCGLKTLALDKIEFNGHFDRDLECRLANLDFRFPIFSSL